MSHPLAELIAYPIQEAQTWVTWRHASIAIAALLIVPMCSKCTTHVDGDAHILQMSPHCQDCMQEMQLAKQGKGKEVVSGRSAIEPAFEQTAFRLDYLTEPTFLGDIGLDLKKVDVVARVKPDDEAFVIAYPYFNVNGAPGS